MLPRRAACISGRTAFVPACPERLIASVRCQSAYELSAKVRSSRIAAALTRISTLPTTSCTTAIMSATATGSATSVRRGRTRAPSAASSAAALSSSSSVISSITTAAPTRANAGDAAAKPTARTRDNRNLARKRLHGRSVRNRWWTEMATVETDEGDCAAILAHLKGRIRQCLFGQMANVSDMYAWRPHILPLDRTLPDL